ncbi:MAG: KTSC domain-containing protein [Acidobacteria bacterium]|nr:KTSC domain-containing protein [Acidobacteriota bacterium]
MSKKAFGGMPLMAAGVLAVSGILLAGCASSSTEGDVRASAPAADTNTGTTISGTGGQLIAIQSDNVAAAGYNAASRTMLVEFDDGSLYEYSPVPESVWIDFVAAQPHPWSRVGNPVLVEGGVPYRKVR